MTRRSDGRRKPRKLPQLPRVTILTEGEKTEPIYFSNYRNPRFQLVIINKVNPKHMIDLAHKFKERDDFRPAYGDQIWLVFDKDDLKDDEVKDILAKAKKEDLRVAYSKPCFEIWFLLHFRFDDSNYNREEMLEKLSGLIRKEIQRDFIKADDYYQDLLPLRGDAINNARHLFSLRVMELSEDIHRMSSVTMVDVLVRELLMRIQKVT